MTRRAQRLRRAIRTGWFAIFCSAAALVHAQTPPAVTGSDSAVVKQATAAPPLVAKPCRPGNCPFAGQTVTVLASGGKTIAGPIRELREEFEAATGARLVILEKTIDVHYASFISDASTRSGKYDISMAGAWWLGELVESGFILSYDSYYGNSRFPAWDIQDVLPAPRRLLSYGGKKYMVANDHDGQVMYYRRDLLADPKHKAAFRAKYGYALDVPRTMSQLRDVAEYFTGKDLNGDDQPGYGLTMALRVGAQGMFHFMSFSAPYLVGPENPKLYWFEPRTMAPLIESPGHVQALRDFVGLVKFGPREMLDWDLGRSWDYFLAGQAALTFTWGDLGGLSQQEGSKVKGKLGVAPIPGTERYYSIPGQRWIQTASNAVGNTVGGSWAGVVSRSSKAPEAAYYLLALMANKQKGLVYAARGWDGIDPGRTSQMLPPHGTATIDTYLRLGWNESDAREYLSAYAQTFSNPVQFPYLRIPGAFSYWQALDAHLAEATRGQLSPEAALRATAVDFEEITLRLGRHKQKRSYNASLGLGSIGSVKAP
jgi:multiple sugar transport system substrate-binding protein